MTSSIPSQPAQQLTSFVCPKGLQRDEYYEAGLAEEKLALKDHDHIDQAIGYLKKAAEKGKEKAWVDLARVIIRHKPEFIDKAIKALEKVTKNNPHKYPEADHLMADIYLGGSHKDVNKAIDYLRNCNDTMAPRRLVSIYLSEGRKDEALAILQQKADEGDSWSCLKLGLLCFSGEVHEGQNQAESLLEKGKTQALRDDKLTWNKSKNSNLQKSNLRILNEPLWKEAIAALNKIKVAKDESTANESTSNEVLNDAKKQFEESEKSESDIEKLYNSYQEFLEDDFDKELEADPSEEKTNFRDAGRLAYREKDEKAAFSYWKTGAAAGSKDCLYFLGCCFNSGKGCIIDEDKAAELWNQAAEGPDGNSLAKQKVSRMEGNDEPAATEPGDDVETENRADKTWLNRVVEWIRTDISSEEIDDEIDNEGGTSNTFANALGIATLAAIAFAVITVIVLAIWMYITIAPVQAYQAVHTTASALPLGRPILESFMPFTTYGIGVDTFSRC